MCGAARTYIVGLVPSGASAYFCGSPLPRSRATIPHDDLGGGRVACEGAGDEGADAFGRCGGPLSPAASRPSTGGPLNLMEDRATTPVPADRPLLGELVVQRGVATRQVVQAALKRQRRDRRRLGELLLDLGVDETGLTAAVAEQLGVRPVDFNELAIEVDAVLLVEADLARRLVVMPLFIDDFGRLHIATPTPQDAELRSTIAEHARRTVVAELAERTAVLRALDRNYTVLSKGGAAAQRAVDDHRGPAQAA